MTRQRNSNEIFEIKARDRDAGGSFPPASSPIAVFAPRWSGLSFRHSLQFPPRLIPPAQAQGAQPRREMSLPQAGSL